MLNLKKWQELSFGSSILCFFAAILLLLMCKSSPNLLLIYLSLASLVLCPLTLYLSITFIIIRSHQESTIISQFFQKNRRIRSLNLSNLRLNSNQQNTLLNNYLAKEIKRLEDLEKDSPKNIFFSLILSIFVILLVPDLVSYLPSNLPVLKSFSVGAIMTPTICFLLTRSIRRTKRVLQKLLNRVESHLDLS